jgi:SAM-dependent methyltransferase
LSDAREQRLVFGEVAEVYDRARPGYPSALVDDVLAFTTSPPARALEVGAGTGKATVAFARRGLDLTALEPSPEMAAVARHNLRSLPQVTLLVSSFEDYEPRAGRFDLVFSAQAWHWVDAALRYLKAHALLEVEGVLATFWNRPVWGESTLGRALDHVYEKCAPELRARGVGLPGLGQSGGSDDEVSEMEGSGLFEGVQKREYRWGETYDAERYVELLTTQSDHRMLDDARRQRVLDGVREVIDAHGGQLALDYVTELYLGRRVSS